MIPLPIGADEEKFFELYNGSDFPIKLTGVTINKDEELTWTGIDGEVVPSKGFFAIIGGKKTTPRGFSSGFSAKKSVLIELFDNKGNKIDSFQRGEDGYRRVGCFSLQQQGFMEPYS